MRMGNDWEKKPDVRHPMPQGTKIYIKGTDLVIVRDGETEEYYEGGTCLVYSGSVQEGTGIVPGTRVIIKEFYPVSTEVLFDIKRREDGSLIIEDSTKQRAEYIYKREQFDLGYKYQRELSGSNAMEIAIKPLFYVEWGDSVYIISDVHHGKNLDEIQSEPLAKKIAIASSFAETMEILHENGYIMLDIKPENFFCVNQPIAIRIVDTDSIVAYKDLNRITEQKLFMNQKYMAPDVKFMRDQIQYGITEREKKDLKKCCLTPNADRYAMGVLLYKVFFEQIPEFEDYSQCDEERLLSQLNKIYLSEKPGENKKIEETLRTLLEILKKLLIKNMYKRKIGGYGADKEIVAKLNEAYVQLTSEKLVLRKEIAAANGRFAAYNLLQKYPLYDYTVMNAQGISELKVAILGKHIMRNDMLSAVISIGQMLDQMLIVELVADDAVDFWKDYISENQNSSLAKAVTWEIDGQIISDEIDSGLVDRSLAHIRIWTQDGYIPTSRYYIVLEEDEAVLKESIQMITSCMGTEQIFIGMLQNECLSSAFVSNDRRIIYMISTDDLFKKDKEEHNFDVSDYLELN